VLKTYDVAQYVSQLLIDGTQPTTTYKYDRTDHLIIPILENLQVFAWFGHGEYYGTDETCLATKDPTKLSPGDISSLDLSDMKLAFLGACHSLSIPKYSIGEAFRNRGAQYVFGWKEAVDKDGAIEFYEDFFEHAMDGYNFGSCYTFAYNHAESDIQTLARYKGDNSIYLRHVGDTKDESWFLGQGAGAPDPETFYHSDTLSSETDWYSFSVIDASYMVELWVNPTSTLDADVWIYNSAGTLKGCDINGGTGVTEYISGFIATEGVYYVKIRRDGTTSGSYDLEVRIYS